MKENFRVSLRTEKPRYRLGEPILITFEITNVSDQDVRLLVWNTPMESEEVFEYFQVRYASTVVPYDGRFVKRGDPEASSYQLIRAGQSVIVTDDLSSAYAIYRPGTYKVTLSTRILDALAQDPDTPAARGVQEHRGFAVDPVDVTFEVAEDGEPRQTVAEKVRRELGGSQPPTPGVISAKLAPLVPVLVGGTAEEQQKVYTAHENAGAFAQSAMQQLTWTRGPKNDLSTEYFGAHDAGRYATVRQHFADITGVVAGQQVTYDLTGEGCQSGWYAYTYKNTRKIWLCSNFWGAETTGLDSKLGVVVHELSHAVSSTDDLAYGQLGARNLASAEPSNAVRNADNHEYFTETLAERVITAPVLWGDGKAYMFVAGKYYRYDVASDKADDDYPQPIAPHWPGLFEDRVDAGVVWPDGNAYFFRGSQYVRYE
ncbi:M35 family metallo-endopeptidase, partial [Streptomyces sp. NPDC059499]|uniref:M35 family metallo-endopeptidase n=1 Tax=Streptomyces sp. NPDC059499 TaxID=3346852 RepID=UPI0036A4F0A8